MSARLLAALLAVLAALLLLWALWQRRGGTDVPAVTPAPVPTATQTVAAAAAPTPVRGYRLAGTALGLRGRYAVFEDPNGSTEMYKVGDEVPGLGKLLHVGTIDAKVSTSSGDAEFRVRPAPTNVPDNTPTKKRVKKPAPTLVPSESESSPSDEPAPPAS